MIRTIGMVVGALGAGRASGMGWGAMAAGIALIPIVLGGTAAFGETEGATKRSVVGSVAAAGALEMSTAPGVWTSAHQGAAVIEDSELRSGLGRPALIGLGKHGVISLREGSRAHVGRMSGDGLPLTLRDDASVSFRLPPGTELRLVTDAAELSAGATAGSDTSVQGVVSQEAGVTVLSVVHGTMSARRHGSDDVMRVAEGEQATIGEENRRAEVAPMSGDSEQKARRRLVSAGFLGTKTGLIAAGATVVAVGGGIGIAAAAGAFDSGGDGDSEQGSPFEP
jgi:hypothetical protein